MGKRTKARWLASCMAAVTVLGSAGVPAAAKEAEANENGESVSVTKEVAAE